MRLRLLDAAVTLLGTPYAYRDARTDGGGRSASTRRSAPRTSTRSTGCSTCRSTRIYQLAAELGTPRARRRPSMLLIPDLLGYWLTGELGAECTNASTTGLSTSRLLSGPPSSPSGWASRRPGCRRCASRATHRARSCPASPSSPACPVSTPVVAVGSHDTASAVVGVPADERVVRLHLLRHLVAGRGRARLRRC